MVRDCKPSMIGDQVGNQGVCVGEGTAKGRKSPLQKDPGDGGRQEQADRPFFNCPG